TLRERAELKKLGLTTLSRSLWKAGRRHRWLQRIRGAVLLSFSLLLLFLTAAVGREETFVWLMVVLVMVLLGIIMLAARYLRHRREQTELVANAEELQKALRELQQQAGDGAAILI